jgi:hypothetical protein
MVSRIAFWTVTLTWSVGDTVDAFTASVAAKAFVEYASEHAISATRVVRNDGFMINTPF